MKKFLRFVASAAVLCAVSQASAVIDLDYYKSIDGLKGVALKNAVHELVTNSQVSMLNYGSGKNSTWYGFYETDYEMDGSKRMVVDRYSNDKRYFGSRGSSVSGMNIEHSVANSWWGGTKNNAYKDLFELMPCEAKINSTKSNYAMGVVLTDDRGNGCTKVGKDSQKQWVWEPADKWKGDFARDYFYIFTAYQNLNWLTSNYESCGYTVSKGSALTLKEWAYNLYLEWARNDRVSEIETVRNDKVEELQHNRNPFVDFPNLMEYIWGDSTDIKFNLKTTIKSARTIGGGSLPGPDPDDPDNPVSTWTVLVSDPLTGSEAGFAEEVINLPEGASYIWINDSQYGWKGSAFFNNTKHAAEAILWSPEYDFTNYTDVRLTIDQCVNFTSAPQSLLSVIVETTDGVRTPVTLSAWPAGNKWTFIEGVTGSMKDLAGKKGRLGFRYTSNTSEAPTWEIRNLKIEGIPGTTAIDRVETDNAPGDLYNPDSDYLSTPEYYTLDGRRLDDLTGYHGLIIVRRGSRATKLLIR